MRGMQVDDRREWTGAERHAIERVGQGVLLAGPERAQSMADTGNLTRVAVALTLAAALLAPLKSVADNGSVALGVPLQGIVIDGDLSDWPTDMRRYAMEVDENSRVASTGPEDCEAWFIVGYNAAENAVYVGVNVRDESIVVQSKPIDGITAWSAFDGVEVYIARNGNQDAPGQFSMKGTAPDYIAPADSSQALSSFAHRADGHVYEFRFDMSTLAQPVQTGPGVVVAFDVVAKDRDADGSFHWVAWGRGTGKLLDPTALGDLLLVETGGLGRVVPPEHAGGASTMVTLQQEGSNHWFTTRIQQGMSLAIPQGRYSVSWAPNIPYGAGEMIEVRPGTETVLPSSSSQPTFALQPIRQTVLGAGRVVKAGRGRSIRAGNGTYSGAFHNLTNADGLPDGTISDMATTKDGDVRRCQPLRRPAHHDLHRRGRPLRQWGEHHRASGGLHLVRLWN